MSAASGAGTGGLLPILLPLASAVVYAVGSILLKRGLLEGAGLLRSLFLSNLLLAVVYVPLTPFDPTPFPSWTTIAIIAGVALLGFVGQALNFAALRLGDVSIATPLLGTKVLFVAAIGVVLGLEPATPAILIGAILATAAVVLVGSGATPPGGGRARAAAVACALGSAFVFAAFDLLVSRRGWCGHLCPVGTFYGLLGAKSVLRVSARNRAACDDCMDCFAVCPEMQVITPALRGQATDTPIILSGDCTNCGRCIDVCAMDVFAFTHRFDATTAPARDARTRPQPASGASRAA